MMMMPPTIQSRLVHLSHRRQTPSTSLTQPMRPTNPLFRRRQTPPSSPHSAHRADQSPMNGVWGSTIGLSRGPRSGVFKASACQLASQLPASSSRLSLIASEYMLCVAAYFRDLRRVSRPVRVTVHHIGLTYMCKLNQTNGENKCCQAQAESRTLPPSPFPRK